MEKRTIKEVQAIADQHGWILNPNKKVVDAVLQGQNKAMNEKGHYYCPCKVKKTAENECPCKNSQNEINQTGHCYCNLFVKKEGHNMPKNYKDKFDAVYSRFAKPICVKCGKPIDDFNEEAVIKFLGGKFAFYRHFHNKCYDIYVCQGILDDVLNKWK